MKKTFALVLSLLTLTACGGGGGSSDDPAHSSVSVNQSVKQPVIPSSTSETGNVMKFQYDKYYKYGDVSEPQAVKMSSSNSDLRTLVVDGQTMELFHDLPVSTFINTGRWGDGKDGYISNRMVKEMSYASFGWIDEKYANSSENSVPYIFYQGKPTAESAMPKNNGVKYEGNVYTYAIGRGSLNTYAWGWQGKATFTVDFKDKNIKGTFSDWDTTANKADIPNIEFNAKISGNSFKGSTETMATEGKFYGPKAENLAGMFIDRKVGLAGSFGAEKK